MGNEGLTLPATSLALLSWDAGLTLENEGADLKHCTIQMSDAGLRHNTSSGLLSMLGRGHWEPRVWRLRCSYQSLKRGSSESHILHPSCGSHQSCIHCMKHNFSQSWIRCQKRCVCCLKRSSQYLWRSSKQSPVLQNFLWWLWSNVLDVSAIIRVAVAFQRWGEIPSIGSHKWCANPS